MTWQDDKIEGSEITVTCLKPRYVGHIELTPNFYIQLLKVPNPFWRLMQYLFFGFKYTIYKKEN